MKTVECAREREVVQAALARQWPEQVDAELRAHIDGCPHCGGVALVSLLFASEHEHALRDAHIPAAGQVWWRSALRAHAEAAHAARRPLVWQQGIAGACAAGVVAALVGGAWPSIRQAGSAVAAFVSEIEFQMPSIDVAAIGPLVAQLRPALFVGVAALACVVLTPIVVYYALSDD